MCSRMVSDSDADEVYKFAVEMKCVVDIYVEHKVVDGCVFNVEGGDGVVNDGDGVINVGLVPLYIFYFWFSSLIHV